MEAVMEMAKVTTKGQVTIPISVRRFLGVNDGDKILFVSNDDGSVTVQNATLKAFEDAKAAFSGAAEEAGLQNDEDVVDMIKEIRNERAGH